MNFSDTKPIFRSVFVSVALISSFCFAIGSADNGKMRDFKRLAVDQTEVSAHVWTQLDEAGKPGRYFEVFRNGKSVSGARAISYLIKLRHQSFDPLQGVPPVDEVFEAGSDVNLHIVQFQTPPLPEYREAIEKLGAEISFYLPSHAFLVRMDAAQFQAVSEMSYVRWIGKYQPAYRTEAFIVDNHSEAEDLYPLQKYNIMLTDASQARKNEVAYKIGLIDGYVDRANAGKYLMEATLTPEQLFQVLRFDEVLFVDRWGPFEEDMNNAREYGGANYVEVTPPTGFTGTGVRGEVFDSGFNINHVDFQSRPLIQHTSPVTGSHGASTSGICFGDGTGNADARGLLPDGQGIIAYYSGIMGTSNRYTHTGELVQAPYYAVFQTSSVGSPRTFFYTTISADMDAGLFDYDISHCQSQSNAGNQDSRPQAWAKNIISGGGVRHYNTVDPADDCWCYGASIGPAQDGRIKPDLCAYYDYILTTTSGGTNAYTTGFGGTSGATPIICGHLGLIYEMWHEGIFGNETPGATVFDNKCHMTTAKALLINSANQYPFSGTGHDLTRVHQGWGWPDVQKLYDYRDNMFIVDESDVLLPFGVTEYSITVSAGEPELKVTMTFADPAGNPAAAEARINDLTLKVISPSNVEYWGNNGLLEGNYSTSGGSANTVDTVENVFIENPEEGTWTVEVSADEVVEDGHVETVELDADYALVVSGGTLYEVPPCMGDLDKNNVIDNDDYLMAIENWLGYLVEGDINENGWIDLLDVLWIKENPGACP